MDELKRLADLELIDALGEGEFEEVVRVLLDRTDELGVPSARAAVTTALQRIHAAALEQPDALGLEDPEPFITAIAEALDAL